jgi:general secretion pathway protein L
MAGGLRYWRQQSTIAELETQLAAAKSNAQRVRSAIDSLEAKQGMLARLRLRKGASPGLLDLLDEATRVLPRHSWLTELQLSEAQNQQRQVVMTGLSTDAPGLVGLFDRSSLFTDASLTAPVSLDPVEGRERFTLQAKVRGEAGKAPR